MTVNGDGDHGADVRGLIADQQPQGGDGPAVVGWMQRLCRAAAENLPAAEVGVSLISEAGNQMTYAASSQRCEQLEQLQFTLGEGPSLDAYAARRPVLIPDLEEAATARWPGYAPAVLEHGVQAVFAFPLQVGAARLGTLDVYRLPTGSLSRTALNLALTFAEVALAGLLDHQDRGTEPVEHHALDHQFETYQAQGMLMVQLGVDLAGAMARLRAHAYAHERHLRDVAKDIISGKLVLDPDDA